MDKRIKENNNPFFIVYRTTNLCNNKIYIGAHKTFDLNDRYLGTNKILKSAIKKYGRENFEREVLFIFDNETEMFQKEAELVDSEFIKRKDTYNIVEGGRGWTGLGAFSLENKLGFLAFTFEQRSEISKRTISNMDPEKRRQMRSRGGIKGSRVGMENKSGIHGLCKEKQKENAIKANAKMKELGLGFFSKETQSELGKRGGPKNKGFSWYNDGKNEFKYTAKDKETLSFEQFLSENPQFSENRLKREFKERPKAKGKVVLTNGYKNVMLSKDEAKSFIKENPDYRHGRTNFKNNRKSTS